MGFKLAFCIPVKDAQDYIGKMVESIVGEQVPGDWAIEIVLAVDPSDHFRYREFLAPLLEGHRNFEMLEVHCKKGEGDTADSARNVALRYANSEYVWFVDADDWLCDPLAAYYMVSAADKYGLNACECDFDGPFPCKSSRMMAWLRIMRTELAKAHPFPSQQTQEDRDMYIGLAADPNYRSHCGILHAKFYYYDWGRKDSVTGGRILV